MIKEQLAAESPDLELATMCLFELRKRRDGSIAARDSLRNAENAFEESHWKPIEWLEKARQKALSLKRPKPVENKNDVGYLYVILMDGFEKQSHYGAYVGSSSKPPEERFSVHKGGGRFAAKGSHRMRQLLHSLYAPVARVPRNKAELEAWETALHAALDSVVPHMKGDVMALEKIPLNHPNRPLIAEFHDKHSKEN